MNKQTATERVSGPVLIAVGFGSLVVGIAIALTAAPSLAARRASPYEISPVEPTPVLSRWVEAQITIDARDRRRWVYFDFSRGSVVTDAVTDGHNWDLAFQRIRVATNSGTTNPNGHAGVIKLGSSTPEQAPRDGYEIDRWQGVDLSASSHNPAFRRWYRYSPLANGLVSRGRYYIVRTADRGYVRLKFISYMCPATLGGGMGCVTFHYGYRSDFSRVLRSP